MEAAYDTYESDVNAGNFGNISEIKLNAAVAEAKTTLEVTVAELGIKKEALAALESSETLANWKKVKAEYKAKQDSLNDVVADKTLTANKIVIENREKKLFMQCKKLCKKHPNLKVKHLKMVLSLKKKQILLHQKL